MEVAQVSLHKGSPSVKLKQVVKQCIYNGEIITIPLIKNVNDLPDLQ